MSVETKLNELAVIMKNVPEKMRLFSLSMRSLYAEKALGNSSETAKKINKIRDDTRKDAMIYVKGILPVSTELIRHLQEFFEYYEGLSLEQWQGILPDILEEVRGYKQCCVEIIQLHQKIMIPLKKREDEAKVYIAELTTLTIELRQKSIELETSANDKFAWAFWLFFVPGLNFIATPLLRMSADSDLVKSTANSAQCIINNAGIVAVSKCLIPALSAFIDSLDSIAGFFKVVEEEINTFHNKGEKFMEDAKKQHYFMMKNKAKEIKLDCREFFAMIPNITTNFQCIPQSGNDENYVDRWLKKQEEEIKQKYAKSLTGQLKKMLAYFSINLGDNLGDNLGVKRRRLNKPQTEPL